MDRREFLGVFTSSTAVGWIVTEALHAQMASASPYANPVPLVQSPAMAGLNPSAVNALFTVNPAVTLAQQAQTFPQSVASGDPSVNGIVLWTRVDPAYQTAGSTIAWQIATTSDFTTVLTQGMSTLTSATDNTVKLPITATNLQPYTIYYYRFIYGGIPSRIGRFKTLPLPTATESALNIAFVVCQDYGNGYYTALAHLAQENVDVVIHLGDYIYESIASNFQGNPVRMVPAFPSGSTTIPVNVADYRHLYQVYRSDPNQQAVHENFAYIQLWDDHEFANDCHQDYHPDNNTAPNSATTPQPALRQAANQAWSEYGLADVPFNPQGDANWETALQVYRKFSFGALADVIVTDERLYRDGPPCGSSEVFGRYFSVGCPAIEDTSRTMLGAAQKAWFLNQVTTSKATWKLWANEVMLMQLKIGGFIYVDLDQWDGYGKEREAMFNTISNAKVKNFIALTGDLHTFLAGYLKANFDNPFASPMGIEFMVGSISSANLAEDIESVIELPSRPLPGKQFGVAPNALEPLIRLNNPHIQYWDSSTHGYAILTLTAAQLTCVFKAVTTIRSATANLVTLRTFTVPNGQVHLSQS